jgi:hypothetical protein
MKINRKNNRKTADCPLALINKVVSLMNIQVAASAMVRRKAILKEGSFGRLV